LNHRLLGAATFAAALICPALVTAAPAFASAAESRATLEQACRDDGMADETCSCLGDFVAGHFSERELAGAARVFSDPTLTEDPGAAIGVLVAEGFSLMEITAVANRIMDLETAAKRDCAGDDAAPVESQSDAGE